MRNCHLLVQDSTVPAEDALRHRTRAGWAELSSARDASPSLCQPGYPWFSSDVFPGLPTCFLSHPTLFLGSFDQKGFQLLSSL